MEKEIKTSFENSAVKIHACFQESETLRFLTFLQHKEGKLIYRGVTDQQNRKSKQFYFDSISLLTDKLKNSHSSVIRDVVESLLRGQNRSLLVFGNDESKKEKLLIGESQNAGILLLILSQLFNTSYDRELQDRVTIKLSCWQQSQTEIGDAFGANNSVLVQQDQIEGKVLIGNPQVIVRNMKSALKIIKLFMRRAEEGREVKEGSTQTLVISVKLQIDNGFDKQGNVIDYKLSKLHVVKFANPYSIKANGKHPQWFISLFNYFQADAIEKMKQEEQQTDIKSINYIKECVIRDVHAIHCFTCFGNKMNANQCLTTLKFTSYLHSAKITPKNISINLPDLKKEHLVLESELLKNQEQKQGWLQGKQFVWVRQDDNLTIQEFKQIMSLNIEGMQLGNILEYQYAIALTVACDKLEKYIFNQEVQDYFYAKKVSPQVTPSLRLAVTRFMQVRKKSLELQRKILQRVNSITNRLRKDWSQNRAGKYLINSKMKQKQIFQKLFLIYNTEVSHFLYEQNEQFSQQISKYSKNVQLPIEQPHQVSSIELSSFTAQIIEKAKQAEHNQPPPYRSQAKRNINKKNIDQLEMMFTNSNVNLCGRRIKN